MKIITKELCPYCERVELTFKIRKISSETIHLESSPDGVFPDSLVAINPNKTFPTIQVTAKTGFAESMVIVEYLDSISANGPILYGDSPEKIATTKFHLEVLSNTITSHIQKCCYTLGSVVEERKSIAGIPLIFELLGRLLESRGSRFLGGDDLNAEDVHIAPFILRYLAINSYNNHFPLPIAHSRTEKYFHDLSHHPIVRKCIPSLEELAQFMKKYSLTKGLNVEEIKNSSRKLVQDINQSLKSLNENFKTFTGWKVGKDEKGNFIHTNFNFKDSNNALKAVHLLNEIQEASDHHSAFVLENFSNLNIKLCTHQPKYGITEMDFSFARIITNKLLEL